MAGQWRHGAYEDFDPSKMVTAEIAIVTSGDPNAENGRSIYVCFSPGVVKRFATYEDFIEEISNATADIRDQFTGDIDKKIMEAEAAVLGANSAASAAEKAKEMANTAAEAANEAAKKAEAAAGGEISEKTVTFQEAAERANIKSGDTLAVAFGKLAKYCTDFEEVTKKVTELNTNIKKINPLNVRYVQSDFDKAITGHANENAFAFGHSEALASKCGYWVFVITLYSTDRFSQIAIGENGMASRYYDTKGWRDWK